MSSPANHCSPPLSFTHFQVIDAERAAEAASSREAAALVDRQASEAALAELRQQLRQKSEEVESAAANLKQLEAALHAKVCACSQTGGLLSLAAL